MPSEARRMRSVGAAHRAARPSLPLSEGTGAPQGPDEGAFSVRIFSGGSPKGLPYPNSGMPLSAKNWCRIAPHQFTVLIETALFWENLSRPALQWRLSPPSARPPQKNSAFPGSPIFAILRRAEPAFRQENFRLLAENFAWTRRSARLASARKRPNWTAFSRPASRWRPWPPSARPLFCCGPYRNPRGFRSGPPPRKSACRGRGPPRR